MAAGEKGTHSRLRGLAGDRLSQYGNLLETCETLDALPCSDLNSLLIFLSEERSAAVNPRDVLAGNRFHSPSDVPQRKLHIIEGVIYDTCPDLEFVELSPLQPFGTNALLAGIDEKNVVATLRGSEVNADPTTALTRYCLNELLIEDESPIHRATHSRAVRAQKYEAESKLLPHFKVFSQVTVGKHGENYGFNELLALGEHLKNEVAILDAMTTLEGSRISELRISISNLIFSRQLVDKGELNIAEGRKKARLLGVMALSEQQIIEVADPDLMDKLSALGFTNGLRVMQKFIDILKESNPKILPRLELDLNRIAGLNYYKHLAYKIIGVDESGAKIPLADGGTTDWASKLTGRKNLFTVTSGVGTELLARHLVE